jgi:hypothetical protein
MPKLKHTDAKMVRFLHITAKCKDCCFVQARDSEGEAVGESNGYVPYELLPHSGGDHVRLLIDVETGQIIDWKKPSLRELSDSLQSLS